MNTNEIPTPVVDAAIIEFDGGPSGKWIDAEIAKKIARELHESRQREARLISSIKWALGCGQVVGQSKKVLNETLKSISTTPAETMVPWSVASRALEQFKICFDDARSYGPGDADADFQSAIDLLQSYAPKEKGQS